MYLNTIFFSFWKNETRWVRNDGDLGEFLLLLKIIWMYK